MRLGFPFLLATAFLSACSSASFEYLPENHKAAKVGKQCAEAVYSEPAAHPQGKVSVISMGIQEIEPSERSGRFPALHIRVSLSNRNDIANWTFNETEPYISLPDESRSYPLTFNLKSSKNFPLEIVHPGEIQIVDLYFKLPHSEMTPAELADFQLHWTLQAGDRSVREVTRFDRTEVSPPIAAAYPDNYFDPYEPFPYEMGWGW